MRRDVLERMKNLEGMTASELQKAGNHPIPQIRLSSEAKKRLAVIGLDDIEELWSFRLTGQRRFWCIKDANIYALLWWDPYHKVYPVQKS